MIVNVADGSRVYLARLERDLTGGVSLHLIHPDTTVELQPGAEYVTVLVGCDPYAPPATEET